MGLNRFSKVLLTFCLTSLIAFQPYKSKRIIVRAENFRAKAACVMEVTTRRILYEENGAVQLPIASTTKIATAITVLENCDNIEAEITVPPQAVGVEGSSAYLTCGQSISLKDLLYGLMLRSGNDCAVALALHCSNTLDSFAVLMNKTAQKAGALSTHFHNPHGLPNKKHYSTARDMSFITCYAMHNTAFRKLVATKYYENQAWKNKNKMLFEYDGAIGVKTGYTMEAGRCLVTAAERNGMMLVSTVLNCPATYEFSARLLDDAFSAYEMRKIVSAGDVFEIEGTNSCRAVSQKDIFYPLLNEETEFLNYKLVEEKIPHRKDVNGEIVGQIQIYLSKQLLFSENLYKL